MRRLLRIGELAEMTGTTANAVRFYHEVGLLREPERSESGYRLYDEGDLAALGRVLRLRSLGLPVAQVRGVISEELALGTVLEARLGELNARLAGLEAEKERVSEALRADAEDLLDGTPPGAFPLPEEMGFESEADEREARREVERLGVYAQKVERILSSFRWPRRYLGVVRDLANARLPGDDDPEAKRRTGELARRWFALHELPEDDPEVGRLVEEVLLAEREHPLSEEHMNELWERILSRNGIPKGDPVLRMAKRLVERSLSPSQRRFAELYRRRKRELFGKDTPIIGRSLAEWLGDASPASGGRR
jgi:DNA-binding transcriptional MerR regulator